MDLPPLSRTAPDAAANPALRRKAEEMETAFLAEMLAHAGLRESSGPFSGGAGETQFASFLRQEQARLIAARGGTGLAEHIFSAMTRGGHAST
jgi:Rod binding domain-containing protein